MFNDYDYFLLVVDEMNISRAAKRAFISQQCLSKHIKRLESDLGVTLFNRKPSLSLTPAGEIVLERARQIKALSYNLECELAEIKSNDSGTIIYGSSMGRTIDLFPNILPQFFQRYPNVNIISKFEMTSDMETQIREGKLNLFLGLSPTPLPDLEIIPLAYETLCFAISDEALLKYFPEEYPQCKLRFAGGVDLREFTHVPFMINPQSSRSNTLVNRFLERQNLNLNFAINANSNELHIALASRGCGACFFPQFLSSYVNRLNKVNKPMQQLNVFPVIGMNEGNELALVHMKNSVIPNYMNYFILLIRQYFSSGFEKIDSLFPW